MNFPYTDGFFSIDNKNGFLPIKAPFKKLPDKYENIQNIINILPELIKNGSMLKFNIDKLKNNIELVKEETDIFIIQALYRAYTFITSAYLLQPSYENKINNLYGKGRTILPIQLTQSLEWVSNKLDVFPWLDYHYAYSLGNYIKKDENKDFEYNNLEMACSFSGTTDETGFIMVHVDINSHSPNLIKGIELFSLDKKESLKLILNTMEKINERRKQMWNASNPANYNNFRVFIMGIQGNTDIFGEGVEYEGSENKELRTYRGQSGSQDDIIPTVDIFSGIFKYYPNNILTKYLLDMRKYRPKPVQKFLEDLENNYIKLEELDDNELKLLYMIIEQIYGFRNGHWMFVQKYIMSNTKYTIATGGTPITTWIPNQIEAVLEYMRIILTKINDIEFKLEKNKDWTIKYNILLLQIKELKNKNYDINLVYNYSDKSAENLK